MANGEKLRSGGGLAFFGAVLRVILRVFGLLSGQIERPGEYLDTFGEPERQLPTHDRVVARLRDGSECGLWRLADADFEALHRPSHGIPVYWRPRGNGYEVWPDPETGIQTEYRAA